RLGRGALPLRPARLLGDPRRLRHRARGAGRAGSGPLRAPADARAARTDPRPAGRGRSATAGALRRARRGSGARRGRAGGRAEPAGDRAGRLLRLLRGRPAVPGPGRARRAAAGPGRARGGQRLLLRAGCRGRRRRRRRGRASARRSPARPGGHPHQPLTPASRRPAPPGGGPAPVAPSDQPAPVTSSGSLPPSPHPAARPVALRVALVRLGPVVGGRIGPRRTTAVCAPLRQADDPAPRPEARPRHPCGSPARRLIRKPAPVALPVASSGSPPRSPRVLLLCTWDRWWAAASVPGAQLPAARRAGTPAPVPGHAGTLRRLPGTPAPDAPAPGHIGSLPARLLDTRPSPRLVCS